MTRSVGLSGSLIPWKRQKSTYAKHVNEQQKQLDKITTNNTAMSGAAANDKFVVIEVNTPVITSSLQLLTNTLQSIDKQILEVRRVILVPVESQSSGLASLEDLAQNFAKQYGFSFELQVGAHAVVKTIESLGIESHCLLLNAGDELTHPNALLAMSQALEVGDSHFVYTDTDTLAKNSERVTPRYLPQWDPDLLLTTGYIRTGVLMKSELLAQTTFEKNTHAFQTIRLLAQVYNQLLDSGQDCSDKDYSDKEKATANIKGLNVSKLDLVLVSENSKAVHQKWFSKSLSRFFDFSQLIEAGHVKNVKNRSGVQSIAWNFANHEPLVSLIIPTKNQKTLVQLCIDSIVDKTTYTNYEIILVDNNSDCNESLEYFDQLSKEGKVRLLKYPHPFNYSAINNFAAKQANGSVIGLINNDVEVIEPEWLSYMVGHVSRPDVGCVGAKLLYPNKTIQHAGVVMGYGGGAGHAHKYFDESDPGYLNRIAATNSFSAVTAACLLVTKQDFDAVAGLNENDLTVAFNDVDFCLKVKSLNKRNIYCAEAVLFHHESISRGDDVSPEKRKRFESELSYLQTNWADTIERDPCYNPWLTLKHENFSFKELG